MCWTARLACRPSPPQRPERWCSGAGRGATRHLTSSPNARLTTSPSRTSSHRSTMSLVSVCVVLHGDYLLQLVLRFHDLFFSAAQSGSIFSLQCCMCGCSSAVTSPVVCEGGQCAASGFFFLGGGHFVLFTVSSH